MANLTPDEEKELLELEAWEAGSKTAKLSPDEDRELAELEAWEAAQNQTAIKEQVAAGQPAPQEYTSFGMPKPKVYTPEDAKKLKAAENKGVEEKNPLSSFAHGAAQTLSAGFADELEAGARTLINTGTEQWNESFKRKLDETRARYSQHSAQNKGAYYGGAIAAGAALPALGVSGLGASAAFGALSGLGETEGDKFSIEGAKNAAIGGTIGAAFSGVNKGAQGVGRTVVNTAGRKVEEAVAKKTGETLARTEAKTFKDAFVESRKAVRELEHQELALKRSLATAEKGEKKALRQELKDLRLDKSEAQLESKVAADNVRKTADQIKDLKTKKPSVKSDLATDIAVELVGQQLFDIPGLGIARGSLKALKSVDLTKLKPLISVAKKAGKPTKALLDALAGAGISVSERAID